MRIMLLIEQVYYFSYWIVDSGILKFANDIIIKTIDMKATLQLSLAKDRYIFCHDDKII